MSQDPETFTTAAAPPPQQQSSLQAHLPTALAFNAQPFDEQVFPLEEEQREEVCHQGPAQESTLGVPGNGNEVAAAEGTAESPRPHPAASAPSHTQNSNPVPDGPAASLNDTAVALSEQNDRDTDPLTHTTRSHRAEKKRKKKKEKRKRQMAEKREDNEHGEQGTVSPLARSHPHEHPHADRSTELHMARFHPQLFRFSALVFFHLSPAILENEMPVSARIVALGRSILHLAAARHAVCLGGVRSDREHPEHNHTTAPASADSHLDLYTHHDVVATIFDSVFVWPQGPPPRLLALPSAADRFFALLGLAEQTHSRPAPDPASPHSFTSYALFQAQKLVQWVSDLCEPLRALHPEAASLREALQEAVKRDAARSIPALLNATSREQGELVRSLASAFPGVQLAPPSAAAADQHSILLNSLLLHAVHDELVTDPATRVPALPLHPAAPHTLQWRSRTLGLTQHSWVFPCCGAQVFSHTSKAQRVDREEKSALAAGEEEEAPPPPTPTLAQAAAHPPSHNPRAHQHHALSQDSEAPAVLADLLLSPSPQPLPSPHSTPPCLREKWINPYSYHPGRLESQSSRRHGGGDMSTRTPKCSSRWGCCQQSATSEGCQSLWRLDDD